MNHVSVSPTDSIPTLVRVFLCPCVGPFPSVGLTITWFIFIFNSSLISQLTFTTIYINLHNLHTLFLLFLSLFHNNFVLIGHFKQCVQSRKTCGVLKIERYGQRLTHRACMGRGKLLLMRSCHRSLFYQYRKYPKH